MNAQQAENLRVLIRHMETRCHRTLDMGKYFASCGAPACALGEATVCGLVEREGTNMSAESYPYTFSPDNERGPVFGLEKRHAAHLFGMSDDNAWRRDHITPQEWATEARKVLAENGYSMDVKPDPFPAFMARVMEPVAVTA